MKTFTIIGVWDNGQVWIEPAKGADAYEAMKAATRNLVEKDELSIVGAIEGEHTLITPGDDNGMAAYACDLAGADDE